MTRKLFPRVPHLPGSRTGPGDRHVDEAAAQRCTGRPRTGERVTVQEKLDGTCVVVKRTDGVLGAFGREGRPCAASRNDARRAFDAWFLVNAPRFSFLAEDERLAGEWLTVAHGTRYALPHEPFVAFDLFTREGRASVERLRASAAPSGFALPHVLHAGDPLPLDQALTLLGDYGFHGALDGPEGLVYRVERGEQVELVAKYVHHGKVPGRYLSDHSGAPPVHNAWPGSGA